jgi:NitT/TauT family transport system substrate-binding protein
MNPLFLFVFIFKKIYNEFRKRGIKMKKIFWVILMVLLLLQGCTAEKPAESVEEPEAEEVSYEPITLRVGSIKGPSGVGMVKIMEDNPVLGENVTSQYEIVGSPDILVAKVLKDETDIAVLPTNVAAMLYNKGVDYQLVGINTWGVLYLVENGETVSSWDDIKGKTVTLFAKGSSPDVVFRYLMAENGLTEEDVNLEYMASHIELSQMMIAGEKTIGLLPEPMVTMVQMKNSDLKVAINLQESWEDAAGMEFPQGCLVARKDLIEERPEVIEAFLDEYNASCVWVNDNLEEAGALVEKYEIGMTVPMAVKAIPKSNIRLGKSYDVKETVEKYLDILYAFSPQEIGGKVPDEEFYYIKK